MSTRRQDLKIGNIYKARTGDVFYSESETGDIHYSSIKYLKQEWFTFLGIEVKNSIELFAQAAEQHKYAKVLAGTEILFCPLRPWRYEPDFEELDDLNAAAKVINKYLSKYRK